MKYDEQDCIRCLKRVAAEMGKSPTHNEWREKRKEEDLPSYGYIVKHFGSWNNAKEEANLSKNPAHSPILEKPDNVSMSDEKWQSLAGGKRTTISRKAKAIEYKLSSGCEKCGYDKHEAALEFHHPNGREGEYKNIEAQPHEDMLKEMEECRVLCGNCHNIEHREKDYISH